MNRLKSRCSSSEAYNTKIHGDLIEKVKALHAANIIDINRTFHQ